VKRRTGAGRVGGATINAVLQTSIGDIELEVTRILRNVNPLTTPLAAARDPCTAAFRGEVLPRAILLAADAERLAITPLGVLKEFSHLPRGQIFATNARDGDVNVKP
jgi:hypothetical protein